jgi:hypothetical protein
MKFRVGNTKFRCENPKFQFEKPEVLVRKLEVSVRKPEVSVQNPEVSGKFFELETSVKVIFRNASVAKPKILNYCEVTFWSNGVLSKSVRLNIISFKRQSVKKNR